MHLSKAKRGISEILSTVSSCWATSPRARPQHASWWLGKKSTISTSTAPSFCFPWDFPVEHGIVSIFLWLMWVSYPRHILPTSCPLPALLTGSEVQIGTSADWETENPDVKSDMTSIIFSSNIVQIDEKERFSFEILQS